MNEKKLDDFESEEFSSYKKTDKKRWIEKEMTVYECPECGDIRKEPWRKCHMCGASFIVPDPLKPADEWDGYFWHDPDIGPDGKPFEKEGSPEDTGRDGEDTEA